MHGGQVPISMASAFTILIVEDDDGVRESTAAILDSRGFRVLVAESGYEAMRLLAQGHVDLLLADVVMPGLNGIELVKQAKLLRPELKVIFMTGYLSRSTEALELGKLLFKPVREAHLMAALTDTLDGDGP